MLWKFFNRTQYIERGELARRVHSEWLTRALESGHSYPRIPTRPVDEGGFTMLMATTEGRRWSAAWWDRALEQVEDLPGITSKRGKAPRPNASADESHSHG